MTAKPARVAVLLLAGACGDRSTSDTPSSTPPAITAEGPIAASGSASAAASAAAVRVPELTVRSSFAPSTVFFPVEKSIIACTGYCMAGSKSAGTFETFVVDRGGVKKVPLSPEGTWRAQYAMSSVFNQSNAISFYGSYPNGKLYAKLAAPYDRSGYGSVGDLMAGASGWEPSNGALPVPSGCALDPWLAPTRDTSGCSETRRKLLPKLAKAPFKVERFIELANGAGLIPLPHGFARTDKLEEKPAPWKRWPSDFVPLSDGSILAASDTTVYRIRPDDSIEVVEATEGETTLKLEGLESPRIHVINEEAWLAFTKNGKTWLAMTSDAAALKVFRAKPTTEPARPPHDIPLPTKLDDSCTTPYAVLSSNTAADWVFAVTLDHFVGDKLLAEEATFMSIVRNGANYFGVQVKSRAALDKVKEIANAQRIKPQLACLDALGKIPDVTNPPAGVEIYFVNFQQEQLLSP